MRTENASPRRALILDFDGVVVDTEPVHFASWNQAFDDLYGLRVSGDYHQLVGLGWHEIFDLWCNADDTRKFQLSESEQFKVLRHKTKLFYDIGATQLHPIDGCLDLINEARSLGWYVGVASRAKRLRLHKTLELINLQTSFDVILANEDVIDETTGKKVHSRVAGIFNIDPQLCIVIEDSLSGIDAALSSGIGTVIGLTTSFETQQLSQAGAHQVVDSFTQIQLDQF